MWVNLLIRMKGSIEKTSDSLKRLLQKKSSQLYKDCSKNTDFADIFMKVKNRENGNSFSPLLYVTFRNNFNKSRVNRMRCFLIRTSKIGP